MSKAVRGIAPITNKRIGRLLKRERQFRCLSVDELSTRIGLDRSTVSGWEVGLRPIPLEHIPALVENLISPENEVNQRQREREREELTPILTPEAA